MSVADILAAVHGPWAYAVLGVAALVESAAFVGLLLPGETVMLLAGVLAAAGRLDLVLAITCAIVGSVLGDQVGYSLGRVLGPRLRTGRLGRLVGPHRWARAEDLVERQGGPAVLLGRWIGLLRAVVPAMAGATGMSRAVFTCWNVVGGALWASAVVALGYLAGGSWATAQRWLGTGTALVVAAAVVVLVGVVALRWRRRPRPATS